MCRISVQERTAMNEEQPQIPEHVQTGTRWKGYKCRNLTRTAQSGRPWVDRLGDGSWLSWGSAVPSGPGA